MLMGGTVISTIEYHGNMSLVIFLAKCPLRCPYCHNSQLLESGTETELRSVRNTIDDSADFIDAVIVSGGEPLLQVDDACEILKYAKSINLKTKFDTSGVYPDRLAKVLDYVDCISLDIKAPFNKYVEVIGADIGGDVKKSMDLINNHGGIKLECRTTYVSSLLDDEDIIQIAKEIKCDEYTIQQFRNRDVLDESLKEVECSNPHDLENLAYKVKQYQKVVKTKTAEFGLKTIN